MHGVIFLELERYLTQQLGKLTWEQVKQDAGVAARIFIPVATYPDEELGAILRAASPKLRKSERLLLEEFGIFIAPQLLRSYRFLVKNDWTTLDVLENVESVLHAAVRRRTPLAEPPRLAIERTSPTEVVIVYNSPRKLCEFARSMIEGLAQFFDETVHVSEQSCMHDRAPACRMLVTKR